MQSHQEPIVSSTLARGLVAIAQAARAPARVTAPLDRALGDAREDGYVAASAEDHFWEASAEEPSLRELGIAGVGATHDESWAELGLLVRTAADVHGALESLADCTELLHGRPMFHLARAPDGSGALVYDAAHDRERTSGALAAETALIAVVDGLRRATGDRYTAPARASLIGRSVARISSLERALACEVVVGAALDRLSFDRDVLRTPLPGADTLVHALSRRVFEQQRRLWAHVRPSRGMRRAALAAVRQGTASLDGLAEALRARPRQLRAQLAREGLSLRQLLDDARRTVAELMLLEGTPAHAVGEALGYGDRASFRRACRRWWGIGPYARGLLLRAARKSGVESERLSPQPRHAAM